MPGRDDAAELQVAVLMGSASDAEIMDTCERYLQYFEIPYEIRVISAHRKPDELREYVKGLPARGARVVIAAAGMAAHLPGVVASQVGLPVIGVPLSASDLRGLDALLSIVQMPAGIPVATVAIGKAGAANAAVLAAEILALTDENLQRRLHDFRKAGAKLPS